MTFHETMDTFNDVRHSSRMTSEFFIEAVAYQQAALEEMERRAFSARAMQPIKDKRARLRVAARYIKNGTVKSREKAAKSCSISSSALGLRSTTTLSTLWCG
jgi:hypothetical protein